MDLVELGHGCTQVLLLTDPIQQRFGIGLDSANQGIYLTNLSCRDGVGDRMVNPIPFIGWIQN